MRRSVVLINSLEIQGHPVSKWRRVTRPREPYRWEPVIITETDAVARRLPKRHAGPYYYYLGAIGDHLLRLSTDAPDTLFSFIRQFGLGEFLEWTQERDDLASWNSVYEGFSSGRRTFGERELRIAWEDTRNRRVFDVDQSALRYAYDMSMNPARKDRVLRNVLDVGWEQEAFRTELAMDKESGVIVERPTHIFARAWLELVDTITDRHLSPRSCSNCGETFTPGRSDQRYCTTKCRHHAADSRRNASQKRKRYKTKHQQKQRGAITSEEFNAWSGKENEGN